MNYELFTYQQIFERIIDKDQKTSMKIAELKADITLESGRILTALQNNIGSLDPPKAKQYIQQHQQAIHKILEDLDEAQHNGESSNIKSKEQIMTIFSSELENLLSQIQKYFPAYFNYQSKIPNALIRQTKPDIEKKTMRIIEAISHRNNQEQPISNLKGILYPVFTEHLSLSYQKKEYMESFLERIGSMLEQTENGTEIMDIILYIISSGYNHPLFYKFCCRYFIEETERCEGLSAQYGTLNFIKKCIQQTYPSPDKQYNPGQPSIQQSLIGYISSELEYLKSMDQIGAHLHQHGLLDERYKVTLTVKQLAIFIHLQVEANIIITESPKLLHEYIAKHYSTNETDKISSKSFKNAYYSASTEDLEKVIDKIVTMLALAQEKL